MANHLVRPAEVSDALGTGGAMEIALKAKQEGKIRFIGFSAHTTKSALQALKTFPFDTVNRESFFLSEEKQVALNLREWTPVYPDSPYEGGSAMG